MVLNVLICTLNQGIVKVSDVVLDPIEGVEYIVSHQITDEKYRRIPKGLNRSDITVSQIFGKGLSKNRNNAIALARGDVAIVADDDVVYKEVYFRRVIDKFRSNPNLDVALFKIKTSDGDPEYVNYPQKESVVRTPTQQAISSIEIAFRLSSITSHEIAFDHRFGIGSAKLVGGEELLFIKQCLMKNLRVVFFPEYVVEHPYQGTKDLYSKSDSKLWMTRGAIAYALKGDRGLATLAKWFVTEYFRLVWTLGVFDASRIALNFIRGFLYIRSH